MAITIPDHYAEIALTVVNELSPRLQSITFGVKLEPAQIQEDDLWLTALEGVLPDLIQDCTTNIHVPGGLATFYNGPGSTGSIPFTFTAPIDGARSGSPMTPNVAYLYQKQSIVLGRSGRGRLFLPGVDEDSVDGSGLVDSGFFTDMTNHAETFLDGMNSALEGMFILGEAGPVPVTTLAPQNLVATQRRRLRK